MNILYFTITIIWKNEELAVTSIAQFFSNWKEQILSLKEKVLYITY